MSKNSPDSNSGNSTRAARGRRAGAATAVVAVRWTQWVAAPVAAIWVVDLVVVTWAAASAPDTWALVWARTHEHGMGGGFSGGHTAGRVTGSPWQAHQPRCEDGVWRCTRGPAATAITTAGSDITATSSAADSETYNTSCWDWVSTPYGWQCGLAGPVLTADAKRCVQSDRPLALSRSHAAGAGMRPVVHIGDAGRSDCPRTQWLSRSSGSGIEQGSRRAIEIAKDRVALVARDAMMWLATRC